MELLMKARMRVMVCLLLFRVFCDVQQGTEPVAVIHGEQHEPDMSDDEEYICVFDVENLANFVEQFPRRDR